MKWLFLSDVQMPYQDDRALKLWMKVLRSFKPDVIDVIGDLADFPEYSRWTDGKSSEFANKYKEADVDNIPKLIRDSAADSRNLLTEIRKIRKDADMHITLGNHDIRPIEYVDKKYHELVGIITPEYLWDLDKLGIDYIGYTDLPKHRYGGIHVHHGNAVSKHAGESVRNDMESWGVSLVRGHSHRLGEVHKTYELRNETINGWEIGHLMDEKSSGAKYTSVKNWQKGFAAGFIDGDNVHIHNVPITQDYTCYVGGKIYRG